MTTSAPITETSFHPTGSGSANRMPSVSSAEESQQAVTSRASRVNNQRPHHGGRQKDEAWRLVEVDQDNTVWCLRCGQLIYTQGHNHIARVRRHVYEKCSKLPTQSKITEMFKPSAAAKCIEGVPGELCAVGLYDRHVALQGRARVALEGLKTAQSERPVTEWVSAVDVVFGPSL
ncbi:hypothetical protein GN958_ATG08171 [Phytophthora infestans]|uniref:BED-type domain-containing protein n=1 Tax=Phytophthora infestans TaxID=4787 RepID=A0A8S9USP1_PHYIN|nr:hypothetical protein GN958_ATG08171 [Phytophthora infestans]